MLPSVDLLLSPELKPGLMLTEADGKRLKSFFAIGLLTRLRFVISQAEMAREKPNYGSVTPMHFGNYILVSSHHGHARIRSLVVAFYAAMLLAWPGGSVGRSSIGQVARDRASLEPSLDSLESLDAANALI